MYSWTCVFYSAKHCWCHPTKKNGGPGSGNLGKSLWALGSGLCCVSWKPRLSSRMDGFFFGFDLQNQGKCWVRNMSRVDVSLSMQQVYIYIIILIIYIYIVILIYHYVCMYIYTVHISMTLHWATFIRWLLEPKIHITRHLSCCSVPRIAHSIHTSRRASPMDAAATSTRGLRCCRRNTSKPPLGRG